MPDTPLLRGYITEFVSKASLEQRKVLISLIEECEDAVNPYLTADNDSSSEEEPGPSHNDVPTVCPNENQVLQFVAHVKQLLVSSGLSEGVLQELTAMKLRTRERKGKVAKVKTQWLIPNDDYLNDIKNPKQSVTTTTYPNSLRLLIIITLHLVI